MGLLCGLCCATSGGKEQEQTRSTITEQDQELIDASRVGNNSVVQELLTSGADVNAVDRNGSTPLIAASSSGRNLSDVVTTLLKQPLIKINIQDKGGYTALHYTAGYGHLDVAKQLVTAGADLTLGAGGMTPAQWAKDRNQDDVYKYLSNL